MARPLIDVHFALWLEDDVTCPLLVDQMMRLPAWAEIPTNAEEVVNTVCRDRVDTEVWEDWFGNDEDSALVYVTITAPDWLVGTYEVVLTRVIKAATRKIRVKAPA